MRHLAWDTETARFGPGRQAPPLACVSVRAQGVKKLLSWREAEQFFLENYEDEECIFIGHNVAYDFAVLAAEFPHLLPKIFDLYEKNRVRDTMIRQKLLDIAMGVYRGYHTEPTRQELAKGITKGQWIRHGYSLDDLNYRYKKKHLDKDTWRKNYGELRDVPLEEWPEGARLYPLDDAGATWDVFWEQDRINEIVRKELRSNFVRIKDPQPLADEPAQLRAAWWIHLMKCWGIRTNPQRVAKLLKESKKVYDEVVETLQGIKVCPVCGRMTVGNACDVHGRGPWKVSCLKRKKDKNTGKFVKVPGYKEFDGPLSLVRSDGSKDTHAAKMRMVLAMGGESNCRRTKTGEIQLDEDACKASNDIMLDEYTQLTKMTSVIRKDVKALKRGRILPVHSNFDSLIATGRTSSSNPNIQNIRRLTGIRECFVPRKGMVFLDADYDGLELRTLAQTCLELLGESRLAEVLNSGKDPHTMVAAEILGISYDKARALQDAGDKKLDDARQTAKVANFGFPGGLGYEALILFAWKAYKVRLTEDKARELKRTWFITFPEMEKYFAYIDHLCQEDPIENLAVIEQLFVKRIRGNIRYTVACNSFFQGLGSDATKNAGWLIAKACYLDKDSPLYGCRIVNYIHDQFLVEAPEEIAHEACMELKRLMILGASPYLKDVPPTIKKPLVARRWSKDAKQVFDSNKRLIPWDDGISEAA